MNVLAFVKKLPEAFDAEAAAGTDCVLQFRTSQPAYATIKDGTCTITEGATELADVTLIIDDEDFQAMMKGELNPITAFMTGKLQVEGDLMLGQRLQSFFDESKLI